MKKAFLLWKFTPEDSDQSIANDSKETDHNSYVNTGIIDNTSLEKNSNTILEFQLTPLKPGFLQVIGIEYSLKALFPDKEPTDHEIRGKQVRRKFIKSYLFLFSFRFLILFPRMLIQSEIEKIDLVLV